MAAREIRAMTGVRGIAAVFVMIYHFENDKIPPGGPLVTFLNHGYLSVDLFFVLSGFVMAHVYGPSFHTGAFRFGEFLWHRIARIYPLYVIVTLGFLGLAFVKSSRIEFGPDVLLSNLVMLQSLGNWPSIDPPAWSVSTEVVVYLLFPVIGLLCLKSGRITASLVGMMAILAILMMTLAVSRHYTGSTLSKGLLDLFFAPFTLIRCLAGFTLGQLVWRVHHDPFTVSIASRTSVQVIVAGLALVALSQQGSDFIDYLLIVLLILCLSTDRGVLSGFFGLPPLHFLGEISFAVYLIHYRAFGVWNMADRMLSGLSLPVRNLAATAITALVVIGVSWLLHVAVERPCRQWMRKGALISARRPSGEPRA